MNFLNIFPPYLIGFFGLRNILSLVLLNTSVLFDITPFHFIALYLQLLPLIFTLHSPSFALVYWLIMSVCTV